MGTAAQRTGALEVRLAPVPQSTSAGNIDTTSTDSSSASGEKDEASRERPGQRGQRQIRLGFAQPFAPFYPPALIGRQTRGQVSLVLWLDKDGSILQKEVVDSRPNGVFDAAVLAALEDNQIVVPSGFRAGRVRLEVIFDPYSLSSEVSLSRP